MGLESATYIQDLVTTNPSGGDQKAQGDDHIRLIKAVLKNTFPGATAALSFGDWSLKSPNFLSKNANYTQVAGDDGKAIFFDTSGGAIVYSLLAAATAGDGFCVFIGKGSSANTLTIDPTGAETINGAASLVLGPNAAGYLICSGTAWRFFGNGTVQGPASATDHALALWDGTSGNKLKNGPTLGSAGQVLTSNGASSDPSFQSLPAAPSVPTITKYDSGLQSITSGGALSLTHSLGGTPDTVFCYLQCTLAEYGYSAGDVVLIGPSGADPNNSQGAAVTVGATQIGVRFGSSSNAFRVLDKSDGDRQFITNSSWRFVVKAQRFS